MIQSLFCTFLFTADPLALAHTSAWTCVCLCVFWVECAQVCFITSGGGREGAGSPQQWLSTIKRNKNVNIYMHFVNLSVTKPSDMKINQFIFLYHVSRNVICNFCLVFFENIHIFTLFFSCPITNILINQTFAFKKSLSTNSLIEEGLFFGALFH